MRSSGASFIRRFALAAAAALALLSIASCAGDNGDGDHARFPTTGDDDSPAAADDDDNDDDDNDSASDRTWADPATNLMWQHEPTIRVLNWFDAVDYCAALRSAGYDDWRAPTISELRSLLRGCPATETGGACRVTDSCLSLSCVSDDCNGCPALEGPNEGCYLPSELSGPCYSYWSSSTVTDNNALAWSVHFPYAFVYEESKVFLYSKIRCVRAAAE